MTTIGERLGEVLARIEAAARAAGRDPSAVSLLVGFGMVMSVHAHRKFMA